MSDFYFATPADDASFAATSDIDHDERVIGFMWLRSDGRDDVSITDNSAMIKEVVSWLVAMTARLLWCSMFGNLHNNQQLPRTLHNCRKVTILVVISKTIGNFVFFYFMRVGCRLH